MLVIGFLCGLKFRGVFSVLPASWQPDEKATTPKCASGKAPGNTTALCADCLWINVTKTGVRYVRMHIMLFLDNLLDESTLFYTAVYSSRQHCVSQTAAACGHVLRRLGMRNEFDVM